ncbi:MAG: LLM class flavin-dependent oxidoreductase [Alphaproteobacteria bacterium]|jgi:alkanesulfonate monooxygenase SsuD/methylene tetrahydromethanopterin reductase-like flavin-dependent oxidoreductase (luciferase family)
MRFGLFGGAVAQRGGVLRDSTQGYRDFIDYVGEAEELGYHSVFLVEHHFTGFGQVSASLNLLTYLAARTRRIRLGTAVVVLPWHNPVLLAEEAATVDLLSNGRFDFGVGKGYRPNEFHGFNVDQDTAQERFDEALEVIRKAWTSEEPFDHRGRHWTYKGIVVEPPCIQKPHPPLWIAAGRAEAIEDAATRGFNLLLDQIAPFDEIGARLSVYRDRVAALGRDFDPQSVAVARALHITHTEAEREEAHALRARLLGGISRLSRVRGGGGPESTMLQYNDTRLATEEGALIGPPEEIVERLHRLRALGVDYVLLIDVTGSRQSLRTFQNEIMPEFA